MKKLWFSFSCALFMAALCAHGQAADFKSSWSPGIERPWAGAEYWTNPLQDWRVSGARLECHRSGGERTAYLLTRELSSVDKAFEMSVRLGQLDPGNTNLGEGWVGFRIGSRGEFNDYRDSAVRGKGLDVGLSSDGLLYIGGLLASTSMVRPPFNDLTLRIAAQPEGKTYTIRVTVLDSDGSMLSEAAREGIHPDWLTGNIALMCSAVRMQMKDLSTPRTDYDRNIPGETNRGNMTFWFRDWQVTGDKVKAYDEHAWGPILFSMYTLSRNVMKMTAQMAPVGNGNRSVRLEIRETGGAGWKNAGTADIDPLSRTATFRLPDWDDTRATPYRLVYAGEGGVQYFEGTIAKNPKDKDKIITGGLCCLGDMGFPHQDLAKHLAAQNPDILFFMGDQIYESVGAYGVQRINDVPIATLDYLRKWYLFAWGFVDLLKDIPSICMPDDHDVFHGNVWGAGGRAATVESDYDINGSFAANAQKAQDRGGYTMPAEWVKMVQRTQTSHLPDPFDPTPVEQGIQVYYCDVRYGGISFAVVEDRKFKSAPQVTLPEAKIINGWAQNPDWDSAKQGDVPGAVLLGERQLRFLDDWSKDWSGGVWMKALVSQTIFSNLATLPKPANTDAVTPGLRIADIGEYIEGDMRVQDHDSNGWPQTGRNRAIEKMRSCFAVHIAGDQHLPSTIQYGISDWHDANYAICVPAMANIFPRRWFPPRTLSKNRKPGAPDYTGDFFDGFGNRVTVYAVANPRNYGVEPEWITQRSVGIGIITFERETRDITLANWPRWVDPNAPGAKPYDGWPVVINQMDNFGESSREFLPTLEIAGMENPVVQVVDDESGDVVYTIRINGTSFRPKVLKKGIYTVRVGEPETGNIKVVEHLQSSSGASAQSIEVGL